MSKKFAFPLVLETYRKPDAYVVDVLMRKDPFVFDSEVSVRRWRVTFEAIEEPVEVLMERIEKLRRETQNHHHWRPLHAAARELGFEPDPEHYTYHTSGPYFRPKSREHKRKG